MSLSTIQRSVLPPLVASTAVFSVMAIPLALIGDNQIGIKIREEPFFHGRVRDIAAPYIIFTTALSLGAGVCATAIFGWRSSAQKSAGFQEQIHKLEQNIQEKEELLKELKLSESRLQVSGLNDFINGQVPFKEPNTEKVLSEFGAQPVVTPIHKSAVNAVPVATGQQNQKDTVTTVTAASTFASAQTFLGYMKSKTNAVTDEVPKTTITAADFEELQRQIKEMLLQMRAMQDSLRITPQATHDKETASNQMRIHYDSPKTEELQFR